MAEINENLIELKGVNFYYNRGMPNEMHALTDASLEIKRGEFVSFFGTSGCGKSTMLYMISGIDKPDEGKVLFNGYDLTKFSAKETSIYRQMGIGLIFQNFNLIPSLSVIDNVALPMTFLGLSGEKRKQRAMDILKYLNIDKLANRLPYELSGGQQQRVGIARALANDPPLILADEPTGNLDSVNATNTMELLKELNVKYGKTIVLVTHEAWCLRYVNKIFYMKDGLITKTEVVKAEDMPKGEAGKGLEDQMKEASPLADKIGLLAQSASGFVMEGDSKEEVKRAEEFFAKRMNKELTYEQFLEALDKPFREGGLGLWKQKAKNIADAVEEIIAENYEVAQAHEKLRKHPGAPLKEEITSIRNWILEIRKGQMSPFQQDSIDECISERLRNIITSDNFVKVLTLSKRDGGLGFSIPTALKISDRLEMLLSANAPK